MEAERTRELHAKKKELERLQEQIRQKKQELQEQERHIQSQLTTTTSTTTKRPASEESFESVDEEEDEAEGPLLEQKNRKKKTRRPVAAGARPLPEIPDSMRPAASPVMNHVEVEPPIITKRPGPSAVEAIPEEDTAFGTSGSLGPPEAAQKPLALVRTIRQKMRSARQLRNLLDIKKLRASHTQKKRILGQGNDHTTDNHNRSKMVQRIREEVLPGVLRGGLNNQTKLHEKKEEKTVAVDTSLKQRPKLMPTGESAPPPTPVPKDTVGAHSPVPLFAALFTPAPGVAAGVAVTPAPLPTRTMPPPQPVQQPQYLPVQPQVQPQPAAPTQPQQFPAPFPNPFQMPPGMMPPGGLPPGMPQGQGQGNMFGILDPRMGQRGDLTFQQLLNQICTSIRTAS
ncbi:unnamed protein product, partial [Mesorhabditis spiculigera]